MKTIAFYQPHLDIQGTGVSYFDYAYYNEKILKNRSIMICDKDDHRSHPDAITKFKEKLEVIEITPSENMYELEKTLKNINADALYIQKCGKRDDGRYISSFPTFIHCVGCCNDPHGTVYSYVSRWLAEEIGKNIHPYVPYMVNLPKISGNLRIQLGIPENAIVYGRTGGMYSWNIPWVNESIAKSLDKNKNIWFLFLNTPRFIEHSRVIFMEPFADLYKKVEFIQTCNVMLHSRMEGESFGASIAEFSSLNKPIVTYAHSPERNHLLTLGDNCYKYQNSHELEQILSFTIPNSCNFNSNWNMYSDFTPKNVMDKFKSVFIDKLG